MTISSETNRIAYTGSGGTGPFAVPFYFLEDNDLKVIRRTIADGAEVVMALTTDYTLTGAGVAAGGSLTLVAALSASYQLVIIRDPDVLQGTVYPSGDKFPSASHERALDKLTMLVQRIKELVTRSLRLSDGSQSTASLTIPEPAASSFFGWNAAGTALVNYAVTFGTTLAEFVSGIHAATSKATPVDADELPLADSAASFGLKKLTWANLKATLGSTFAALAGSASQAFSASTLTVATDAIVPSLNGGQLAGFRNKIINGGCQVSQRAPVALSSSYQYGQVDRHMIAIVGGTGISGNIIQNPAVGEQTNCAIGTTQAGTSWTNGNFYYQHRIEAVNSFGLNSKTITVSARVFQTTGGTRNWKIALYKPTTTVDTFSAQTLLQTSGVIPSTSGVVTTVSASFTLSSADASLGLAVYIYDSDAPNTISNKEYWITSIQLEVGSVATPFEQRPYGTELALCQRYYAKTYNTDVAPATSTQVGKQSYSVQAAANTYFRWDTRFPVSMRAAPTFTVYSTTGASGNVRLNNASDLAVTTEDAGMSGASLYLLRNAALGDFFWYHWTASAEL